MLNKSLKKSRLLIVDDKQDVSDALGEFLESDFEVVIKTTVGSGRKELREDEVKPPRNRFAVAVFDLKFLNYGNGVAPADEKEKAGFYLVNEARNGPFLEVILMTAFGGESPASDALARSVFRYIKKSTEASSIIWFEQVKQAALSANIIREGWHTLYENLLAIQEQLSTTSRTKKLSAGDLVKLSNESNGAMKNFEALPKTRGHQPKTK